MSIEIEIEGTLLKKLKSVAARKRISKQEYVLRLLKQSLQLDELEQIRKRLKGVARKNGFVSEKDVFRKVS